MTDPSTVAGPTPPADERGPALVTVADGVAHLTLNRPRTINALTSRVLQHLAGALRDLEADPQVRVVVLSGAGRGFSSGWDRGPDGSASSSAQALANDGLGRDVMAALAGMHTTLTVAQVHGACVGGGVLLAAGCDFRYASEDAFFWLPEISFGNPLLWTGVGPLAREIGLSRARYLALSNQRVDASWARAAGLVHQVVPADELRPAVAEFTRALVQIPTRGVELMKNDIARIEGLLPSDHGHPALTVLESLTAASFTQSS